MASTIPNKESELYFWLSNFKVGCQSYQADLGLTSLQLAQIEAQIDGYQSNYSFYLSLKTQLESAVKDKDSSKAQVLEFVRGYAKVFRAKSSISDTILAGLALPPHQTPPVFAAPATPTGLAVKPDAATNSVRLEWGANGNITRTTYVVETRLSATGAWTPCYLGTRRRVTIANVEPGVTRYFRVFAMRRDQKSTPTAPVVVYAPPNSAAA